MIAGLVEGTFGRVFKPRSVRWSSRTSWRARWTRTQTMSVSRVYAPNEYSVWLSPRDRARYEGVEQEVIDELCAYLLEHARGEDLGACFAAADHVSHRRAPGSSANSASKRGWQGSRRSAGAAKGAPLAGPAARRSIGCVALRRRRASSAPRPAAPRVLQSAAPVPAYAEPEEVGNTMIFSNSQRVRDAVEQRRRSPTFQGAAAVSGRRLLVPPRGATIGRSRDCDIVLEDSSISRRHAELRPEGRLGGSRISARPTGCASTASRSTEPTSCSTGDRIEIGSTEMLFEIAP